MSNQTKHHEYLNPSALLQTIFFHKIICMTSVSLENEQTTATSHMLENAEEGSKVTSLPFFGTGEVSAGDPADSAGGASLSLLLLEEPSGEGNLVVLVTGAIQMAAFLHPDEVWPGVEEGDSSFRSIS